MNLQTLSERFLFFQLFGHILCGTQQFTQIDIFLFFCDQKQMKLAKKVSNENFVYICEQCFRIDLTISSV